ncbi:MAG: hypothetical protein GX222_02400 [Ruminococcaceae bacterium]|nr:hypothetical protein [Oscillospiraceae bacterium]
MKKHKWIMVLISVLTGVNEIDFHLDYGDEGYDDYFWDTPDGYKEKVKCIPYKKVIDRDAV